MGFPSYFISLLLIVVVLSTFSIEARVEIVRPYHPLYVQAGKELKLVCISRRTDLRWKKQTSGTAWELEDVTASASSGWTIRTITEEPSGYVESHLTKTAVNSADGGTYRCYNSDETKSFSVWATVLRIHNENLTASSMAAGQPHTLHCNITGFDTNPPEIKYQWMRNDKVIGVHIATYASNSGQETQQTEYNAFATGVGRSALVINELYSEHSGMYTCMFGIMTNQGVLNFTEQVYVDASYLPQSPEINGAYSLRITNCALLCILTFALSYRLL